MPFSRSRSIESMTRSLTSWPVRKAPDCQSIASTSVVLPWSTWATIATLRRSSRRAVAAVGGGGHGARDGTGRGSGQRRFAPIVQYAEDLLRFKSRSARTARGFRLAKARRLLHPSPTTDRARLGRRAVRHRRRRRQRRRELLERLQAPRLGLDRGPEPARGPVPRRVRRPDPGRLRRPGRHREPRAGSDPRAPDRARRPRPRGFGRRRRAPGQGRSRSRGTIGFATVHLDGAASRPADRRRSRRSPTPPTTPAPTASRSRPAARPVRQVAAGRRAARARWSACSPRSSSC